MTIKELIEKLKLLPQEATVFAWSDGNEAHAYPVTEIWSDNIEEDMEVTLGD